MTTPQEVLACPMDGEPRQGGATTVREYLVGLVESLWEQGQMFSGKRPYGYSGWHWDLYEALGRAGYIRIAFDEDGFISNCDEDSGDSLITAAIKHLAQP